MRKSLSNEQILTESFETLLKDNNLPYVKYDYYDLHHQCKGQRYDKLNDLIYKIRQMNENFKYYVEKLAD